MNALPNEPQEAWASTSGANNTARWSVNDVCTKVRVVDGSGQARTFRLRQYEFENGDHFLKSLLPMGPHELLVTHQHGAFVVSDRGRILREMDMRPPVSFDLKGGRFVRSQLSEGLYDHWLRARGWNGRTILATDAQDDHGYAVLLNRRLKRTLAFDLGQRRISDVRPNGTRGWTLGIVGTRARLWIANKGSWRWEGGAR